MYLPGEPGQSAIMFNKAGRVDYIYETILTQLMAMDRLTR